MSDTPKTDARLQAEAVIVLLCQLDRENAALREDKEILDWLDANVDAIMLKLQPNSLRLDVREMVRKARRVSHEPATLSSDRLGTEPI